MKLPWTLSGPWTTFNVYVAKLVNGKVTSVKVLSTNSSEDIHPSITYDPSSNLVFVA